MKLRSLLILTCFLIGSGVIALLHFGTSSVVSHQFQVLEQTHNVSVRDYARTVLDSKKLAVGAFIDGLNRNGLAGRNFLLRNIAINRSQLVQSLKESKAALGCDVFDISSRDGTESILGVGTKILRTMELGRVIRGDRVFGFVELSGREFAAVVFPVKVFSETVAVGVAAFDLNERISPIIEKSTKAVVSFEPLKKGQSDLVLEADAGRRIGLKISVSGLENFQADTRFNVLVSGLIWICLLTTGVYWLLHMLLARSVSLITSDIRKVTTALDEESAIIVDARPSQIQELQVVSDDLAALSRGIAQSHARIELKSRTEAIGEKTAQIAHDLMGPVSALRSALGGVLSEHVPLSKRQTIEQVLDRITVIANQADSPSAHAIVPSKIEATNKLQLEDLARLVQEIVSEKGLQYTGYEELVVRFHVAKHATFLAEVDETSFKRAVSNLIDNATQAMDHKGEVLIGLSLEDRTVLLTIADRGKGIDPKSLALVGQRGFTVGKAGGKGLGVWQAKSVVEGFRGDFSISSDLGKGTTVLIKLPLSNEPRWFVSSIELGFNTEIVVIDDEEWVHDLWERRFKGLAVKLNHLSNAEALINWVVQNRSLVSSTIFLCDHDLGENGWTGLELIDELGIAERSILVTGSSKSRSIRVECERLGTRLLAKSRIQTVAIVGTPVHLLKGGGQS